MGDFILTLLHAATNTHILHWQTKSFAEHMALGEACLSASIFSFCTMP